VDNYDVEAVVTVDGRGQVVLPKEVRTSLGLEAGSKLAVIVMRQSGLPCCVSLMPVGALEKSVRAVLNPRARQQGDRNGNDDGR
jgi:AbrB family looped-hinge helix DNA binding protein